MTASNHVITGAVIGAAISNPYVALSAALLSHLILDVMPHYGEEETDLSSKKFTRILLSDLSISIFLLMFIYILHPINWILMIACGIIAISPDLLWVEQWLAAHRNKPYKHGPVRRFLHWIQWAERPWGFIVEALWFSAMVYALVSFIY